MKVSFSRIDPDSAPGGFDMGDILIEAEGKKISSQGSSQNLMMIYIALSDLMFGVLGLNGARGDSNFVGVDSSFSVYFKSKGSVLEISQKKGLKMTCKKIDFLNALCSGVGEFLASGNDLKFSDSVRSDLHVALGKLIQAKSRN
ncbi:hypothetical protein EJP67_20170 [Variovorax guangxiensis]|uniref:Uncharacterized protein n=1 Tax=Variovorax guangxiensis TaxID=1775474 RepID=A0A3S0Z5W2_9BURK|nr:hypothetical protein [Variovorax guangxiensis]RUR69376.1 hypothetical protein EJP67_20170 [Variovorax guangxiensis]